MDAYTAALEDAMTQVKRGDSDERILSEEETTEYLSMLAKIRWPVGHVIPELAYEVSRLASKKKDGLSIADRKSLGKLLKSLKTVTEDGGARIVLRKHRLDDLCVLTHFDAGFAQEEGLKSQAGFINMVTSVYVTKEPVPCSIAEFQSGTIQRVVKSTMAAESASLSIAVDRHLFMRVLLESILYGEPSYGGDWRLKLKIPGIAVTDARSLFDHLGKTGSVPKERQTLIDLLVVRDLVENGALWMRWVSTTHMLADVLTKNMEPNEEYKKLLATGKHSLVPTLEEAEEETRKKGLRKEQRQRRKERDVAKKGKKKEDS